MKRFLFVSAGRNRQFLRIDSVPSRGLGYTARVPSEGHQWGFEPILLEELQNIQHSTFNIQRPTRNHCRGRRTESNSRMDSLPRLLQVQMEVEC